MTAGAAALSADPDDVPEKFELALATTGADQWPFDLARIQLAFGEYLRRARQTRDARLQLVSALATFQRLGAQPWAARSANELRASGAVGSPSPPTGAASLTPQQREIADLAASGLTNKQIGQRLFLSPRTVATHLYQLFLKLGVTSRAALRDVLGPATSAPERDPSPKQ